MTQASISGNKYEKKIIDVLIDKSVLQNTTTAGSGGGKDITLIGDIGVECKTRASCECGQKDIKLDALGKWSGPKPNKKSNPLITERFIEELKLYVKKHPDGLFYGKMPPLNTTREKFDEWEKEFLRKKKENGDGNKKDYRWKIEDSDFILKNYIIKGNSYIQIGKKGLYYLDNDIFNWGVPKFSPEYVELRIRCKRRGKKGCCPSSLTLSAYFGGLKESPYSLDDKDILPINLQ
uniref:Uncharacterized protein n=1 Tax=viral metagenome TaxID=1070528 RepID=A0A6C0C173_9ZZZZ